jgi:hypothetical protein
MKRLFCLLATVLLFGAVAAQATNVLTFGGFQQPYENILNYYNGGFGGSGSGPGPNYGVVFGPDALALPNGPSSNVSNEPQGSTASMIFLSGPGDIMNVTGGFVNGFSFFYSAPFYTGQVSVYDGLNGTGNVLASLPLSLNGSYCGSLPYSCWTPVGVNFVGTALSVDFTGTANYIAFSNVTLGSSNPGTPEPGTLVMFGSGVLGLAGVIRRKLSL